MKSLELIPLKRFYVHATCFLLGILLAFSFEPFKVPFLSLIAIGIPSNKLADSLLLNLLSASAAFFIFSSSKSVRCAWRAASELAAFSNTFEYKLKTKGSLIKLSNQKSQNIKL